MQGPLKEVCFCILKFVTCISYLLVCICPELPKSYLGPLNLCVLERGFAFFKCELVGCVDEVGYSYWGMRGGGGKRPNFPNFVFIA